MTELALAGDSFVDPPVDSARSFRLILEALSRPLAAILLTLCDPDTTLWLAETVRSDAIAAWLRFHTGARLTDDPAAAAFAVGTPDELARIGDRLSIGTPEYPDRSATLVASVASFDAGGAVVLSGPGNAEPQLLRVASAGSDIWRLMQRNGDLFPLGLDCILASPGALAGVPRSSAIQIAEDA